MISYNGALLVHNELGWIMEEGRSAFDGSYKLGVVISGNAFHDSKSGSMCTFINNYRVAVSLNQMIPVHITISFPNKLDTQQNKTVI